MMEVFTLVFFTFIASAVGTTTSFGTSTFIVPELSEILLSRLLGVFFMIYVVFLFKNKHWKIPPSKSIAITGGILSGFSSGIFGVGGAIRAAFLSAFDLKKEVFIFTAGAIGLFIDSGRVLKYFLDGIRMENQMLIALALAIPTSFLGDMWAKNFPIKFLNQSSAW